MRLAYLLGTYPKLSETFIEREIVALRAAGRGPVLFALTRGDLSVATDDGKRIAPEVRYLPSGFALSTLAARVYWFARRPVRTIGTGVQYLAGGAADPRNLAGELRGVNAGFTLARALEREGIDHLHAHFGSLPASCAWFAHRLTGIPYSLSVHAWDIYVQRVHLRAKLAGARRVVFCHRAALEHVRNLYPEILAEKFELIHHGLALEHYPVPERDRSGPLRVLAVGRLEPKKGFDTLVRAAGHLARRGVDFQVDIIGEGQGRESLEAEIVAGPAADRVRLLGRLPHVEVTGHMARAHVLAAPCRVGPGGDRDGIPNVVLEAMAVGLPVAASTMPGLSEAVEHEVHGLLTPPDDEAALADSLERLAKETDLATRLGQAGRKRIEEEFEVTTNVGRLAGLFDRLASGQR